VIEAAKTVEQGLDMVLLRVRGRVEDATVDLGWRPDETWGIYGAIARHICYSTQGYLGPTMSGIEVAAHAWDETWSAQGLGRDALLALVDETRALAHRALETMTEAAWAEEVTMYNRTMTKGAVASFAVVHGAQHVGQMLLMDRVRKTTGGGPA